MDPEVEDTLAAGRSYVRYGMEAAARGVEYASQTLANVAEMLRDYAATVDVEEAGEAEETTEAEEPEEPSEADRPTA